MNWNALFFALNTAFALANLFGPFWEANAALACFSAFVAGLHCSGMFIEHFSRA